MKRLDVVLPGEQNRWWRRHVDGEIPHLALLFKDPAHRYRGPIFSENRYSSGKFVTAKVYISAGTDFLVEMEPGRREEDEGCRNANGGEVFGLKSSAERRALRLEVTAKQLREVFRGLDNKGWGVVGREEAGGVLHGEQQRNYYECLLAPDRRAELCR